MLFRAKRISLFTRNGKVNLSPGLPTTFHFLNQLFPGRKVIRDLTYSSTERHEDNELSRKVFFDLLCIGDNGEQFIVEMQRAEQGHFKLKGEAVRRRHPEENGQREVTLPSALAFSRQG